MIDVFYCHNQIKDYIVFISKNFKVKVSEEYLWQIKVYMKTLL